MTPQEALSLAGCITDLSPGQQQAIQTLGALAFMSGGGGGGGGGTEMTVLSDTVGYVNYIGGAPLGSSTASSVWHIFKTTYSSGGAVVSNLSATGVAWNDRYTVIYT